jgi:hypothetical protein
MPSILDPSFKYVPAAQTDIRRTFAKARAELALRQPPAEEPRALLGAADLHPALPGWMQALSADERADLERAAAWRDIDARR